MRAILGLDRPTSGRVLIDGRSYGDLVAPLASIGALLDAKALDKGRSARNHLRVLGATVGIGNRRVDEVLELVGLADVAHRPAGGFSLGMGQRLGLAAALLADPQIVMLDEPANGLDPDGILWIRTFLRGLADEGRTVFLSSHLMSEMELTADHLVVIEAGRLIADVPMVEMLAATATTRVSVTSPDACRLIGLLTGPDVTVRSLSTDRFEVVGVPAMTVGTIAALHGLPLHELHTISASLEDAYMSLTHAAALTGSARS